VPSQTWNEAGAKRSSTRAKVGGSRVCASMVTWASTPTRMAWPGSTALAVSMPSMSTTHEARGRWAALGAAATSSTARQPIVPARMIAPARRRHMDGK
jgi:hypothetical protein